MPFRNEGSTRFIDEVRIISPWTYLFVGLGYVAAFAAVVYAKLSGNPPFPVIGMVPLAILGGTFLGCYFLLIGYVNRDAARRGMSPILWTLLALCIPNALGILLYFVLRKPRLATCPQCANEIQAGYNFCPRCNYKLSPSCPQCQRAVAVNDVFCSYCGAALQEAASAQQPSGVAGSGV